MSKVRSAPAKPVYVPPSQIVWTDERLAALAKDQLINLLANLQTQRSSGRVSEETAVELEVRITIDPEAGLFSTGAEIAFLIFGIVIGVCGGPVQSASRAMVSRLAPAHEIGRFYGLYALVGKATAFLAPFCIAAATQIGAHVTIDFGNGDMLVIRNTLVASLHADDFAFG